MSKPRTLHELSLTELEERLQYDESLSSLRWTHSALNPPQVRGKAAGGLGPTGYHRVSIKGKQRLTAHIVWWLTHKTPPAKSIDHINRNRVDNRPSNLRLATSEQQGQNRNSSGGSSKFKGVTNHKGQWQASIKHKQKTIYLGHFYEEIEAAYAYDVAALHFFGAFAALNNIPEKEAWWRPEFNDSGKLINPRLASNNKSGYRGVCWHIRHHKWLVQFRQNGKTIYGGYFNKLEEAIQCRDKLMNNERNK